MALYSDDLNSVLLAAAGSDGSLHDELKAGFVESAGRHLDMMKRSRSGASWELALRSLHALASSFNAIDIIDITQDGLETTPGDPVLLRAIEQRLAEIGGQAGA